MFELNIQPSLKEVVTSLIGEALKHSSNVEIPSKVISLLEEALKEIRTPSTAAPLTVNLSYDEVLVVEALKMMAVAKLLLESRACAIVESIPVNLLLLLLLNLL